MIKTSTPGMLEWRSTSWFVTVLPGNAQEPAEAVEVELVQFLEVSPVTCSGLTATQQDWEDYSSVDSNLHCMIPRSHQTCVDRHPNALLALDS